MGDILIGNPVDHPGIVRVENWMNHSARRKRKADGPQQNIQFIDDRQHDILIIRCKQRITERKALDMIAGKAEQLAGFKRLNLKFRRLLGKIANGGKERKHIISRKTGDTFITVLVYI